MHLRRRVQNKIIDMEGIIGVKCEDMDVSETLGIQSGEIECKMWMWGRMSVKSCVRDRDDKTITLNRRR